MRTPPNKDRAESRVVSKYHKAYTQLIDLIQAVQDLVPSGMQLDETVELTQHENSVRIAYRARPVQIIIKDGKRKIAVSLVDGNQTNERGSV